MFASNLYQLEQLSMFEDNFVEVQPGALLDPNAKLCINKGGTSGLEPDEFYICVGYDPQLKPGRLLVPPSEDRRAMRLRSPTLAPMADDPVVFRSEDYFEFARISATFAKIGNVIRYKVEEDLYGLVLKEKILERRAFPVVSEFPKETLLYALRAAVKLTSASYHDFNTEYPEIDRYEIVIGHDVAVNFFGLRDEEYVQPEPGWLLLAVKEAR